MTDLEEEEPEFYIKGYKVEHDKLPNDFNTWPAYLQAENLRTIWLWTKISTEFLYVASGKEPGGKASLVIVLAEGYNKEELEQVPMVDLSEPHTKVFTPGIWVKDD